jgi:uncharacterized membrane protein
MLVLILFLVVGSLLVYVSKFNFMPVTINLWQYTYTDIPLFYVIIGSVLIGMVVSYLVYLMHVVTTALKLHGKDRELKKEKNEVLELTKRVHQLELENEKLKNGSDSEPEDSNAL